MMADRAPDEPEPDAAPPVADAEPPAEVGTVERLTAELIGVRQQLAAATARIKEIETPTKWIAMKEAAAIAHVEYEGMRRATARGAVIARRIDGRILIDANSLAGYVARRRSGVSRA